MLLQERKLISVGDKIFENSWSEKELDQGFRDSKWDKPSSDPEYDAKTEEKTDCNYKAELLDKANKIVNGDRNVQYEEPDANFKRVAALWSTYLTSSLRVELSAHDVAIMMILLNISRLTWSPGKEDLWLDIAGYAAWGWDTVNRNPDIKLC